MRLIQMKCANCGGKLNHKGPLKMECPYCEAVYLLDGSLQSSKAPKEGKGKLPAMGIALICVCVCMTLLIGGILTHSISNEQESIRDNLQILPPQSSATGQAAAGGNTSNSYTWQEAIDAGIVVIVPPEEGEGFQVFVERILGKHYSDITEQDWGRVTGISVSGVWEYHDAISCVVDGVTKEFLYEGSMNYILPNIHMFVNLETLEVDNSIESAKLSELKKLKELRCYNTIAELLTILPNPENIVALSGVEAEETLDGIEKFVNLQALELDVNELKDMTKLTSLANLEVLVLDAYEVKNYVFLDEMSNLKQLSIDSDHLYSLEFVQNMPHLEMLELQGAAVTSLKPLEGNKNLKTLIINTCSYIEDYEIVSTLTNLEKLAVSGYASGESIQWGKLKKLKYLQIDYGWRNNLQDYESELTSLETLYTRGDCHFDLAEFENLKHLIMEDSDELIYFVEEMDKLETVTFREMDELQGIQHILSSPNIKEVTLFDSKLTIDFDEIAASPSLEKLDIQYCDFCEVATDEEKNYYYTDDRREVELKDKLEFITDFSSLKDLTIRGAKLENVDFVADLSLLQKLDITNNNIADVSILNQCKNLKQLECGDNALLETPVFDWNVMVDMSGEQDSWYK